MFVNSTNLLPGRFLGRAALAAMLIASGLAPVSALAADSSEQTTQPNILLILTDDMGLGDPSCYGSKVGVPTPHINKIGEEGTRFQHYYSSACICSASRAGIITGRYSSEARLNSYLQTKAGNRVCEQDDFLDTAFPMFPRLLKKAGYTTALIGKWHMGGGRDVTYAPHIEKYGYDEAISTWESPQPYPALGIKFTPWDRQVEPGQVVRDKRTEFMVNKTLDYFKENKGKPTFVFLCPDDTHTPHRPSKEMQAKYGGSDDERKTPFKNFEGVLDEYDRQIGRLLDGLDSLGMTSNTLVIFTSDNGPEPHFEHKRSRGLRGMKISLYEGGVNLPFLVRWPGHTPVGKIDNSSVICGVDFFPTLCHIAGAEIPPDVSSTLEGQDVTAALEGKPFTRQKKIFWEYGRHPRGEGYAYPGNPYDVSPNVAMREGNWKLLVNADGSDRELYDIVADPNETRNVAKQHPDVADRMAAEAIAWRKALPAPHYIVD